MKLTLIPAGTFTMGSPASEVHRNEDEGPQHAVKISQPFYMGMHEVTQGEYEKVMGTNPSHFSKTGVGSSKVSGQDTSKFPVESVSQYDAMEFCNKLSAADGLTPRYGLTAIVRGSDQSVKLDSGTGYRLPTEAEWEYACRAGTTMPFHFGSTLNGDKANVDGSYAYGTTTKGPNLQRTTTVGSYVKNAFGLFDMHGNVCEWCQDVYDVNEYSSRSGTTSDPLATWGGFYNVLRGGSWNINPWHARSASRFSSGCRSHTNYYGFRVVR